MALWPIISVGLGRPEGEYDGGEGEQMDLVAVVNWLRDQEDVNELVLAGFSFGSYIALQQAEALQADALCTVAPPVSMYDFTGLSPTMPWVLIQGGQDEVIDSHEVLQWAMSRESVPDIFWRAQASHFFSSSVGLVEKCRDGGLLSLCSDVFKSG